MVINYNLTLDSDTIAMYVILSPTTCALTHHAVDVHR